jgi:outer membrane biosynthesis protein TonB
MSEVWTKWEGQVVNGVFPLRRLLSAGDRGAVFLTEFKAQQLPDAALRLVPVTPSLTQAQLAHWTMAVSLSHPHLLRLLEAGLCRLEGLQFLFVVMEYAEQTLSQILPRRALTPDEVREMLPPILSALVYVHGKDLRQGRLKPANILVVNDQLKLASDTIRPAGNASAAYARSTPYDPPEAPGGGWSAAADLWSLGITLFEALTQHLPPSAGSGTTPPFPTAVPPELANIIRRCLDRNPENRPTAAQLQAEIVPAAQLPAPVPVPVVVAPHAEVAAPKQLELIPKPRPREIPHRAALPRLSAQPRWLVPAIAVLFVIVVAAWFGSRLLSSRTAVQQAASSAAASQSPETALPNPPAVPPAVNGSPSVLHEEIPDVPSHARATIRGHIKIAVRVTVDRSGSVIGEVLENRGPSYYFARLATEAARKWKFAPADDHAVRKWLLRFDFSRDAVTGHAVAARS